MTSLFNGINAETGAYFTHLASDHELAQIAQQDLLVRSSLADAIARLRQEQPNAAPPAYIELKNLSQTGWAVIFGPEITKEQRAALTPLLDRRRNQVGNLNWYHELIYVQGETLSQFLSRYYVSPGPPNPQQLPYYVLIVGSPDSISFSFQYQLDIQYAVGRLWFEHAEEYAVYARSVVSTETTQDSPSRRAAFVGVLNDDDAATTASTRMLVEPLFKEVSAAYPDWDIRSFVGADATKARLQSLLSRTSPPALLVSATHGVGYDPNHPRQLQNQGALICQDWPGPRKHQGPLRDEWIFTGADIDPKVSLQGMIALLFACYSAGTPAQNEYADLPNQAAILAPRSFVSTLAQRMLSNPAGGALAVVGHIDRAWSSSFAWEDRPASQTFAAVTHMLLRGYPVGAALETVNLRYAELLARLEEQQQRIRDLYPPDDLLLAQLWVAKNDARGYVVIGDPAVKLR